MPDDVVLTAEPRSDRGSGAAGRLRRAGRLPAVVYGLGGESTAVTVETHELDLILAHGVNTLITLRLSGDDQLALARQVQRHPVRGDLVHVDFIRVRTDVAISAEVAIHLEGEAEGTKSGGVVDQQLFSLHIEAKPQDIPASLTLDVSPLEIGDHLRVSDLSLPVGVTTEVDPDTLVVSVAAPRVAAAEEAEGEEAEGAEGAGAEGEAAPAAAAEAPPEGDGGNASEE
jgi:large subunit ribosomal protein L25